MTELEILTNRLNERLTAQAKPVETAIAQIEKTGSLLDDYIVPTEKLRFASHYSQINVEFEDKQFWLHKHAIMQIAEKLGVPAAYLTALVTGADDWKQNLAVDIMQTHSTNTNRDRVLLRVVEGQLRGFLSDKYRRLNSMDIFLAFLHAASANGNVLVDAHSGETKGYLEVINPHIVEFDTSLNGRNYAVFGSRIRSSDFGDGALDVRTFMLNVKCMNGLVGETMLRELHLGGRIPEDIKISEETYKKDTAAKASLVTDIMAQVYSPENTNKMIGKIQGAATIAIDIPREIEKLPKLGLTIGETKDVERVLMENDPSNGLEGSPTLWKLVNAMTAVARDGEPERKRDLEIIAGSMLR